MGHTPATEPQQAQLPDAVLKRDMDYMKEKSVLKTVRRLVRWVSKKKIVNKNDSAAESNEQAQQQFYTTLTKNYNTDFGQFEGATDGLISKLTPIVNAGPGQYGFDATEDAAIRGQAITNDAAAAQNAEQAANQQITAQNGGAAVMPTGAG